MNAQCQNQVKANMLQALGHADDSIRGTAATLISQYTAAFPLGQWRDLLTHINGVVEHPAEVGSVAVLLGALSALKQICEDSLEKLFMECDRTVLEHLLSHVLRLLAHPSNAVRLLAVRTFTLTLWMLDGSGGTSRVSVHSFLGPFISGIGALANDSDAAIRLEVCRAVTELCSVHLRVLGSHLEPMTAFMLSKLEDSSAPVVMEACDMLRTLASRSRKSPAMNLLVAQLPRLVPLLIRLMKMTEVCPFS